MKAGRRTGGDRVCVSGSESLYPCQWSASSVTFVSLERVQSKPFPPVKRDVLRWRGPPFRFFTRTNKNKRIKKIKNKKSHEP